MRPSISATFAQQPGTPEPPGTPPQPPPDPTALPPYEDPPRPIPTPATRAKMLAAFIHACQYEWLFLDGAYQRRS